jgi:hypothetical protein
MAKYGLCAVAAAALLCTAVTAATMAAPTSAADRWNDLSVKFRKYHSDDTNVFFHLITTPLGVLSVLSLFNKATNTNMITKALAVVYCVSIMEKMPLHILGTTSFVATGIAMAAASTASLSYAMHVAVSKPRCRFCPPFRGCTLRRIPDPLALPDVHCRLFRPGPGTLCYRRANVRYAPIRTHPLHPTLWTTVPHTPMYIHIHAQIKIHVHMNINIHICSYTYTYTYTYTHKVLELTV